MYRESTFPTVLSLQPCPEAWGFLYSKPPKETNLFPSGFRALDSQIWERTNVLFKSCQLVPQEQVDPQTHEFEVLATAHLCMVPGKWDRGLLEWHMG